MISYSKPAYYDSFRCLAGACPDSCCKEWDILVDSVAAAFYRSVPADLGQRLRQVLTEDEDGNTIMAIENGRCPMWRQDGLCRIQAELGEDALCQVCKDFPRLRHDYGDFVELGLELSCPEAAKHILSSKPQNWICWHEQGEQTPEYDQEAMAILRNTRSEAVALLWDAQYSVPESLALLLLFAYEVQSRLDGEAPQKFLPEQSLTSARTFAGAADITALLRFYQELEVLTGSWKERLENPEPGHWSQIFRSMAVYFVERYWLQAVSDYDLLSRVKLAVASCILVKNLGGNPLETAQLYSKEIENSIENVDAILDSAYTHPAFTDTALLGLLFNQEKM